MRIGCDCQVDERPWTDFVTLAETNKGFLLCTKSQVLFVPSDSFPSEGERTEFRAMLSEKLRENKSLTARPIEFTCTGEDWRDAKWLQFKMGGWIRWLALFAVACADAVLIAFFAPFFDEGARWSPALTAGACVFALILLILVPKLQGKPPENRAPLKIWISEDAIYAQSPTAESRIPWTRVLGCMGDKRCLVLLLSDRSTILLPKRFIDVAHREAIEVLLRARFARKST